MSLAFRVFNPDEDRRPSPTVKTVIDAYLADLEIKVKQNNHSWTAFDNARRDLHKFAATFGTQPIDQCRQHDLTQFLNEHPEWQATNTKQRVAAEIVSCFKWAEEEELADRCPYRRPRILRGLPTKVRRPADPAEYIALMRFGSRPLRQALYLMRKTGMRTCEVVELEWESVRIDGPAPPHLHLEKHKNRRKTGKPRVIALDAAAVRFLANLRRNRIAAGVSYARVFLNCDGNPWDGHTLARHLRRTAERIGLDDGVAERVSAYCLRHMWTVDALEGGAHEKEVSENLGHTTTRMVVERYGSHTRDRLEHQSRVVARIAKQRRKIERAAKDVLPVDDGPKTGA